MALTPDEVEHKQFTVGLRGFDQAEVVRFLKTVSADYRHALEASESGLAGGKGSSRPLGRLLSGIDSASDDFQAVGDQVAEVLRSATDAAANIRLHARSEAEDMVASAAAKRDEADEHAEAELGRLREEIEERRRQAEEQATAIIEAANREARTLLEQASAHRDELAEGERALAERLRTAAAAIDTVLAEINPEVSDPAAAH